MKIPKIIGEIEVSTILNQISSGKTKQEVLATRSAGKGSDDYEYYKTSSITWTPNGSFQNTVKIKLLSLKS